MTDLTDAERNQMKAAAKVEDLGIDGDLANLDRVVAGMIASIPTSAAAEPIDANELKSLIEAIKSATASNTQAAKFLELAAKLGL
jgi:hypothetical protein